VPAWARPPRQAKNLMKLSPPFGFLRLFAGANLRLIGRLLSDQGMKHWRGYAFALGMTGLDHCALRGAG
jgi:hypothetical protein